MRRGTTVKFMPEYGCELPLRYVDWWRLSLTPSLLDALADWQAAFDLGFLRDELGGRFALEIDLWPLEPPE